ncbi:hypothetical protein BG004_003045, partial [Podila humilis]
GDADSQNETAQCYLDGIGTDKNAFEAARYYRLAAAQGAAQMGNSWIFKPKYDQYIAAHAAQAEAEANARKNGQYVAPTAPSSPPPKSPLSPTSLFGTSPPSNRHSTISSALNKFLPSRQQQQQPLPLPQQQQQNEIVSPVPSSTTDKNNNNNGAAAPGRGLQHSAAGDLITSSQLDLKIKQAEALTHSTVIPELMENGESQGKKKHRWSLWPQGQSRRHRSSSTD